MGTCSSNEVDSIVVSVGDVRCGGDSRYGSDMFLLYRSQLHTGTLHARLAITGLRNLGNTCFMNSALQCLSNTQPLADFFLHRDWVGDINKKNPMGMGGELAQEFGKLIRKMWFGKDTTATPRRFKNKVARFSPIFEGYMQHDVQEFLSFLLDGLHEDLNRAAKRKLPSPDDTDKDDSDTLPEAVQAALAWKRYLHRNRSVIVDLFQGQLRSVVCCSVCRYTSTTFDPFMYLSLPIEGPGMRAGSLEQAMDMFTTTERLEGDEAWRCKRCKKAVTATKTLSLWKLPPVLIIHLKRFKYSSRGYRSKLGHRVRFPTQRLDLAPYTNGPLDTMGKDRLYNLYAVSNHHGGQTGGGHYTAFVKNYVHDKWYYMNDSRVEQYSEKHVETPDAYVLFYARLVEKDAKPPTRRSLSTTKIEIRESESKLEPVPPLSSKPGRLGPDPSVKSGHGDITAESSSRRVGHHGGSSGTSADHPAQAARRKPPTRSRFRDMDKGARPVPALAPVSTSTAKSRGTRPPPSPIVSGTILPEGPRVQSNPVHHSRTPPRGRV